MIVAAALGAAPPSFADVVDVGLSAGTLGIGPQIGIAIVPGTYGARIQFGYLSHSYGTSSDGVAYKGNLTLRNVGLLGDWYPWAGAFRLSGGLFYNGNRVSLNAQPDGDRFIFGGDSYTAAQVGSVQGQVSFNAVAPYLGLGLGGGAGAGLRFSGDLGVMYQGTPKVRLTASNPTVSSQLAADLQATESGLQASLGRYRFYPVVQLGLTYRF